MSQPALTTSIRKLEAELGFELFDRKCGFELTAMGREFHPRAKEALNKIHELERDMDLVGGGEAGTLRLGCGPAIADGPVGEILAELLVRKPNLRMKIQVTAFHELPALLDSQEIDLAIGDRAIGSGSEDYEVIPLPEREVQFYCRKGHPLLGKSEVGPEDFFSYPIIGPQLPREAQMWLRENHPERTVAEALSLECGHYALLKKVVAKTDAISGAPSFVIAEELRRGELVLLETTMKPMLIELALVKLKRRNLTPAAMELIEMLKGV
jgi:DNA-binding transcriptional LysR family regulator